MAGMPRMRGSVASGAGVLLSCCALTFSSGTAQPTSIRSIEHFPRVELHVHLDGSINATKLYQLLWARNLTLPGGARPPRSPAELESYLLSQVPWHRFDVVNDIIGGDVEVISRVAEAFVGFQASSGVGYTEVRYDPVRLARSALANASVTEEAAVRAVQQGLAAGAARHGVVVHQILSAMRGKSPARCLETAALAARLRSQDMGGVVGLDLAGDEVHYPNGPYVECIRHAKVALGLNTTVHAGEFNETSSEEVRIAVLEMGVDRVGHGYDAARDAAVLALLRERRVHVEACPGSALRHGLLEALGAYKAERLNFGLNTDDPVSFVVNTSAAEDEVLVKSHLGFTDADIRRAYASALSAAFGPTAGLPRLPSSDVAVLV